jgi:hypothetical protein
MYGFSAKLTVAPLNIPQIINKIKIKSFECLKSTRNYKKELRLGTSDAWSQPATKPPSQRIIL